MESFFSSIDYKDPAWLATAFVFGYLGRLIGLPPLVGFLLAGFVLNYLGATGGEFLYEMADLGVTLLLFSIGLKLRVKELLQREVWASALVHMLLFSSVSIAFLWLMRQLDLPLFADLSWLNITIISFSLSFSSTVFVVKTLENTGQLLSRFGQIAIGVLIIQDLVAVVYLGLSEAKVPSIWALLLLTLIYFGRDFLGKLLNKVGHGELQILFGLSMALGGAALFEAVDLKADLGALVFGVLLAGQPKASELSRALFSLKELFLVGFFLSIGLAGLPEASTFLVASLLCLLLLLKSSLFFLLFTRFGVRASPANRASFALGNYSEFGLIVTSVAVVQGWLPAQWLVAIAVTVAISFAISSIVNTYSEPFYNRFQSLLVSYQTKTPAQAESKIDLGDASTLICGMGRVGDGAYQELGNSIRILALDIDSTLVAEKQAKGYNIAHANIGSTGFWSRLDMKNSQVNWVLLTAPNMQTNLSAARLIRQHGYTGFISASAKYSDEKEKLLASGVDAVLNIYEEAGAGLAIHSKNQMADTR